MVRSFELFLELYEDMNSLQESDIVFNFIYYGEIEFLRKICLMDNYYLPNSEAQDEEELKRFFPGNGDILNMDPSQGNEKYETVSPEKEDDLFEKTAFKSQDDEIEDIINKIRKKAKKEETPVAK